MEYGGEKSLNDLIEERNKDSGSPFPAAVILRVALHMARGLKVTVILSYLALVDEEESKHGLHLWCCVFQ